MTKKKTGRPSNAEVADMARLRESGVSVEKIAEMTQRSEATVTRWTASASPVPGPKVELIVNNNIVKETAETKDNDMDEKYFARMAFNYLGRELEEGEVLWLRNAPNDDKLLRLGYVMPMTKEHVETVDDATGRRFANSSYAYQFARKRKKLWAARETGDVYAEERFLDKEDKRREDTFSPLT